MPDIQQEYSSMQEIAVTAENLQSKFDELRDKLKNVNETINSCWKGNAQAEAAIMYNKLSPKLKKASKSLSKYSKAISRAIEAQKRTEKKITADTWKISF